MRTHDFEELQDSEIGPRAEADQTLLDTVAERWQLGRVLEAYDIGGTYNLNLRVQTTTGDYVVRVHRPWVTTARLQTLQTIKKQLHAAGFPVPQPLATPAGATLLRCANRLVEVEPFMEGGNEIHSWEYYRIAFSMLGKLHDTLDAVVDRSAFVQPRASNYGTPQMLLRWTQRTATVLHRWLPTPMITQALQICAETHTLLLAMQDWWQHAGSQLPQQPIHGDYRIGNVLFDDRRVLAILDLDFVAVRERVYDLAYSLYWMFRQLEPAHPPDAWSWEQARRMLHGYNAATDRPLSPAEVRAIPLTLARVPLYWIAEAGFLPDPARAIAELADNVTAARWLLGHNDQVANRISA